MLKLAMVVHNDLKTFPGLNLILPALSLEFVDFEFEIPTCRNALTEYQVELEDIHILPLYLLLEVT